MSAESRKTSDPSSTPSPALYRATLGAKGKVIRGAEVGEAEAIAERKAGRDVVVCGGHEKANRKVAQRIENAVGPNTLQAPHDRVGPYALPHFQPKTRPPDGHTFYETRQRKAAKKP